jgi:hypothetical protein
MGLRDLLKHIGEDYPEDKEIYFTDVLLAGVDLDYILWGIRTIPKDYQDYAIKLAQYFACDCAEHVLHFYERIYPADKRPHELIEATRKFVRGEIDATVLVAASEAGRTAASEAIRDVNSADELSAREVAWAAVYASDTINSFWRSARITAWHAVNTPACASMIKIERKWQKKRLIQYLEGKLIEAAICSPITSAISSIR